MNKEINLQKKQLFCVICGNQSESRNYNVISCASEKCRGCRLDKCLIEGMDPLMIKINDMTCRREFIEMLEKRRNKLQTEQINSNNSYTNTHQEKEYFNYRIEDLAYNEEENEEEDEKEEEEELINEQNNQEIICVNFNKYKESTSNQCIGINNKSKFYDTTSQYKQNYLLPLKENAESSKMELLIRICEAQSRIRNAFFEFDEKQFLSLRFNTLQDLLIFGPNIISNASEFSEIPNQKQFYEKNVNFGQLTTDVEKRYIIVGRLLCISIFKSLPFFLKLDLADQIIILKYITPPLSVICNCFVSYELSSYTWVRKDGTSPMVGISKLQNFNEDKKLYSLAKKAFNNPIETFYRIGITKEEFSLLLAIICSNPDIEGLSETAKNILSIESSRYSKILLNYLQNKLGQDEGTKKYSECILLIGNAYINAKNIGLLFTYMELFYKKKSARDILPNCLKSLEI
uniref:NR LBD domain-containing protein n=1 Tax=Meloidogyne hapla TaxID=6305 RepID=A0A1I8BIE0_MELHA